jgi:hypothetical protein
MIHRRRELGAIVNARCRRLGETRSSSRIYHRDLHGRRRAAHLTLSVRFTSFLASLESRLNLHPVPIVVVVRG